MWGTTKIYQTEWQTISLVEVAKELGKKKDEVAGEDFYEAFYRKLEKNDYKISDVWKCEKKHLGKYIFDHYVSSKEEQVISLGCGIGIAEEEMIEAGYNIELQECQDNSFNYLKEKGVEAKKVWITKDLSDLPSNTYDVVIINHVMYCFDDIMYLDFMKQVKRIMKKGGQLILVTEKKSLCTVIWSNIVQNDFLRKAFRRSEMKGILWGYLRTVARHRWLLKRVFETINVEKIDENSNDAEYIVPYYKVFRCLK